MGYDKFPQLEPSESDYSEIDKRILESSRYFLEVYQSIVLHIEMMRDQYYAAGDELGIDPEDVKSAWDLYIGDLSRKIQQTLSTLE